jgi:hypothetical protein
MSASDAVSGSAALDAGEGPTSPLVSIVTAAYNAEETLRATLDSVQRQTESDWELIVVDDGSTDSTADIAREYASKDPRIVTISQPNAGTAAARNAGAKRARARWLMSLDADDLIVDTALESQLEFIAHHPMYKAYTWGHSLLMEDGSLTDLPPEWGLDTAHEYSLSQVALARVVPCCSVWWDRAQFELLGGYRDTFAEDYELMLRAALTGVRIFHNPQICELYRIRSGSKSHAQLPQQIRGVIAVSKRLLAQYGAPADVTRAIEHRNRQTADELAVGLSEDARREFVDTAGGAGATRQLYIAAMMRRPSLTDRWLWMAPAGLLGPRWLSRRLARRAASLTGDAGGR